MRGWPMVLAPLVVAATCSGCSVTPGPPADCTAADLTLRVASAQWDQVHRWSQQQVLVSSRRDCTLRAPAELQTPGVHGWTAMRTVPYTGPAAPPLPLPASVTTSGPTVVVDVGYTSLARPATCEPTDARVVVDGAAVGVRLGCWQSEITLGGPGAGAVLPTTPGQEMWVTPGR